MRVALADETSKPLRPINLCSVERVAIASKRRSKAAIGLNNMVEEARGCLLGPTFYPCCRVGWVNPV